MPEKNADLTIGECEVMLEALGYYQIRLYDQIKSKESSGDFATLEQQSDLVSNLIKKIHRILEDLNKNRN